MTETPPTETKPVPGAKLQVLTGPNAGISTIADASGSYQLPDLWGAFDVMATATGFDPQTFHVSMDADIVRRDVQLLKTLTLITETFGSTGGPFQVLPHSFSFPVHHAGTITVSDVEFYGFESTDLMIVDIVDGERVVASKSLTRDVPRHTVVVSADVPGGTICQVRLSRNGTAVFWQTITFTHPN